MARKLKEIDPDEISLVDQAANLTKFYITKRRTSMNDELIELLKQFVPDDEELTEDDISKAEEMSDEAKKALTGALNILNKYKGDFPPAVLDAIKTLTKFASYGKYPAKKSAEIDDDVFLKELVDVSKAGAKLSKATIEQLKKIKAVIDEMIGAREKDIKKDHQNLPDDVVSELEQLRRFKADTQDKENERIKKDQDDKEKVRDDKIAELEKELKELKKKKPVKKSKDGQDDPAGGDDDDDKTKWPSLSHSEEE